MQTISQTEQIKHHLESGKTITPLEALANYGCMRLGARIHDLKSGMNIHSRLISRNGKRFAEYSAKPFGEAASRKPQAASCKALAMLAIDWNHMIGDTSLGEIVVSLIIVLVLWSVALWSLRCAFKRDKARRWPTLSEVGKANARQLHLWNEHLPHPTSRAQFEVLRLICDRSADLIIEKRFEGDESNSSVRIAQAEAIRQANSKNVYIPEEHGSF